MSREEREAGEEEWGISSGMDIDEEFLSCVSCSSLFHFASSSVAAFAFFARHRSRGVIKSG